MSDKLSERHFRHRSEPMDVKSFENVKPQKEEKGTKTNNELELYS